MVLALMAHLNLAELFSWTSRFYRFVIDFQLSSDLKGGQTGLLGLISPLIVIEWLVGSWNHEDHWAPHEPVGAV